MSGKSKIFQLAFLPCSGLKSKGTNPLPDVRFSVNNTLMVENVASRKIRESRRFFSCDFSEKSRRDLMLWERQKMRKMVQKVSEVAGKNPRH